MKYTQLICIAICFVWSTYSTTTKADVVIGFSDLSLATDSYYNGGPSTNQIGWDSGIIHFGNEYSTNFGGVWNGFSYSNINDTTTDGFVNQYAASTGTGVGGSGIYAVAFNAFDGDQTYFNLPTGFEISSVQVTNTTYAYLSMLNGDGFAKKFVSGDFFRLIFTGYDTLGGTGSVTGSTQFLLADFTNGNSSIVNNWTNVDLSALGQARSVRLTFESSDVSVTQFGTFINTPTYAAFDNFVITAVPEPSSLWLMAVVSTSTAVRRRRKS